MTLTRRLGAAALVLGAAAPFAGSPYRGARGRLDLEETARVIAAGEDHVNALHLAAWIRDRKPGLRVVDVRSRADFEAYAIPTAENLPIEAVPRARFAPEETVVLYSEGGAHAAQAWMLLRAAGVRNALFVPGGLADWRDEVISPVLPADAPPEQAAAFERAAELSRYFGGSPRIAAPGESVTRPTELAEAGPPAQLARTRRRGC